MDVDTEQVYHHGQCKPSASPGAYYSKHANQRWGCWSDETPLDLRTDSAAKEFGYEGACLFLDWYAATQPKDVDTCDHVPIDCSPGGSLYWGACHSKMSEKWTCFRQPRQADDPGSAQEVIQQVAVGDCKSMAIRDDEEGNFYDGACKFEQKRRVNYKCDTIPTFGEDDAHTCAPKSEFHSACFSLTDKVAWQCFPKQLDNPGCEFTPSPDGMYDGTCFFNKARGYRRAQNGANLEKED